MKLRDLLIGLPFESKIGTLDKEIWGIEHNSKMIKENYIFVAIKGFKFDGHNYITEAIKNGANTLIVENDVNIKGDVTIIKVSDSRKALSKISANYYYNPSKQIKVIGITGTNGKTSTTYFLESIFKANNSSLGIVGSLGSVIDGKLKKADRTTPESSEIQRILNLMIKSKQDYCAMEVSSHALELNRVDDCIFDVGIFTNLSVDHLDYHKTIDNYLNAKLKLFYMTKRCNIINIDDAYGQKIINKIGDLEIPIITYGVLGKGDITANNIKYSPSGVSFRLNTPRGSIDIKTKIPGLFTVYNALASASCAYVYGIDLKVIREGLESIIGVKGRFEVVPTNRDYTVIIDFAHTPDSLEKALKTVTQFAKGRRIVLFGAGGDRDKSKRPIMGEVAAKNSDLCIVTSDNPRTENPEAIILDVLKGVKKAKGNYVAIVDRKEAIKYALENGKKDDVILLAGKGHETYTIIGNEKLPFDERVIIQDILKKLN